MSKEIKLGNYHEALDKRGITNDFESLSLFLRKLFSNFPIIFT